MTLAPITSSVALTRVPKFSKGQFVLVAKNPYPETSIRWDVVGFAVVTYATKEGGHGQAKLFETLEVINIYVSDPRQHYYECSREEALADLDRHLSILNREIQDKQNQACRVRALLNELRAQQT